ncbi:MAG: 23S rRNA (uracil(1939)-C(5))-methyltransferase RlmD [Tannerellaceae bacterium]|jgi:23S rRNA (uracil1939-C5)-methyltransferase|nr:23S rRNA (uracil(1939)-C(5))-methyltransferase RlmD [Tannerellaceae bacterium]
MARKRKELPLLEGVEVTGIAAEGKAIAKVDEQVVFIPFAAPGDVGDILLTRKKQNYAEGVMVRLLRPSPLRVEPFCKHFGTCGGCKWQHLPYGEQLRYKHQQVIDSLERIGKVKPTDVHFIVGSERQTFYRNKLEFTFNSFPSPVLGFHTPGRFDKVLDVNKCWLQEDISNRIRLFVKSFCLSHEGYSFFDPKRQEGLMRNLMIRTSSTGEIMVVLVFFYEDEEKREALLNALPQNFPEITSLQYVVNTKCNDSLTNQTVIPFYGKNHIIERMEGLSFKIGPKSFYQTNSEQAYTLYHIIREFAALTGKERIYDLYTGTGTIANFLAARSAEVVGIEYVAEAVEDAHSNAILNNITNTRFFTGDMKDLLTTSFFEQHGRPDLIVTDPPRAGMHTAVTEALLTARPTRIIYVSCNPATQARDLQLLSSAYNIRVVQPVDMFPHTHHVENVALLCLNEQ